jgi:phosphatidylserine/phosphatidylglycerophosphate/cardiolipin synthase-like enzyme
MPIVVKSRVGQPQAAGAGGTVFVPELVPRNCTLETYKKIAVPSFQISGDVIAYASPDSTFAVTKRLFDAAKKSIAIGIYDFTADHVKQLVLAALNRGVKVELMLDLDGKKEEAVFDELQTLGVDCTPAPSCASQNNNKFFRSSHEKFIVIDDEITMVQSGNYSDNSIPLNTVDGGTTKTFITGNRDMGLAMKSKPMAKFFRKIFRSDVNLELSGPQSAPRPQKPDTFLVEAAPTKKLSKLFPSKTIPLSKPLTVQPILTPDNYMLEMPARIAKATTSILIQQQYIRAKQPHIVSLLSAIKTAKASNPGLDVRIVLGKLFNKSKKELAKEDANLKLLSKKFGLKLGTNIRYVDETRLVHCHNKLILVDGEGVLVSSQNWSDAAVSENREAGLWLEHKGIAGYFTKIFELDWSTAAKSPVGAKPQAMAPQAIKPGRFVKVMAGDYKEV